MEYVKWNLNFQNTCFVWSHLVYITLDCVHGIALEWDGVKKTRRKSHDICSTGWDFACAEADVVHVRAEFYKNRDIHQWMLCMSEWEWHFLHFILYFCETERVQTIEVFHLQFKFHEAEYQQIQFCFIIYLSCCHEFGILPSLDSVLLHSSIPASVALLVSALASHCLWS